MGLGDFICSVGSAIVNTVKSIATSIGSAISSCASSLSSAVASIIDIGRTKIEFKVKFSEIIDAIVGVISAIGRALGLIKPEENMQELGEKALQADEEGHNLEEFDNDYERYKAYIDGYKIDEKKRHSPQECQIASMLTLLKGLELKYPGFRSEDLLAFAIQHSGFINQHLTPRLKIYEQLIREGRIPADGWLMPYISEQTPPSITLALQNAEKKLTPGISTFEAADKINTLKIECEKSQNFKE